LKPFWTIYIKMFKKLIVPLYFQKANILAFIGYCIITSFLFYPILFNISSEILYPGDNWGALTLLMWTKDCIFSLRNPAIGDYMSYPYARNIIFPMSPLYELVGCFLQLLIGVVATLNILVLTSYVLSGFFSYLLNKHITKNSLASFVGGVVFAFSTPHLFDCLYNTSIIFYLPLYILALFKIMEVNSRKNALILLISTLGLFLSSIYWTIYFGVLFFIFYFSYLVYKNKLNKKLLKSIIWTHLVSSLIAFPIYYNPIRLADPTVIRSLQQIGIQGAYVFSTDLLNYFLPSYNNPLWKHLTNTYNISQLYVRTGLISGGSVYFGTVASLLSIYYLTRGMKRSENKFWLALFVYGFTWSLGPVFKVSGITIFKRLPYIMFTIIPFLNFLRAPGRIYYLANIALSVLVSLSIKDIIAKFKKLALTFLLVIIISIIMLVDYVYVFPVTTQNASVPYFYYELKNDDSCIAVIQLPPGGFNLVRFQFYSYSAGKKTTSPLEIRPSESSWQFVRGNRLLSALYNYYLFSSREFSIEAVKSDYSAEIEVLKELHIRYIILHRNNLCSNYLISSKEEDDLIVNNYDQFLSLYFNRYYEDAEVIVFNIY